MEECTSGCVNELVTPPALKVKLRIREIAREKRRNSQRRPKEEKLRQRMRPDMTESSSRGALAVTSMERDDEFLRREIKPLAPRPEEGEEDAAAGSSPPATMAMRQELKSYYEMKVLGRAQRLKFKHLELQRRE
jgi:hypothetical protein